MDKNTRLEDPRRRLLVEMLSVGAISAGLPGSAAVAQGLFGTRKLAADRSIYRLKGSVSVNGSNATLETRIYAGDVVSTGPNSSIIFVIEGRSTILRSNTQLEIEGERSANSFLVEGLRLLSGKLLSVSRGSRTRFRTSTATIGIRGTGWYAEADPEKTYFCTCYGETDIAAANDPNETTSVSASHHDQPLYILGDSSDGKRIRDAPFINHTDQELMLIESLVGREPPFVFPDDDYSGPRRDY